MQQHTCTHAPPSRPTPRGVPVQTLVGFAPLRPDFRTDEGRSRPSRSTRPMVVRESVAAARPGIAPVAPAGPRLRDTAYPQGTEKIDRAVRPPAIEEAPRTSKPGPAAREASGEHARAPRRRKLGRWLLIPAVPALLWAGLRLPGRASTPAAVPADVVAVVRGDLSVQVLATGKVEPALQAQIRSRVGGVVSEVLVEEGQQVQAGDVLLRLDPADHQRDVEQARAHLAERRAELRLAGQRHETARRGLDMQALPAVELQTAEADLALARARLAGARAGLRASEDRLRYATIAAPFGGTIIHRSVQPGEVVAAGMTATAEGKPLLVLGDARTLLIRSELNQIDIARVRLGNKAAVTFDALPGRTFQAELTALPASSIKGSVGAETFPIQLRLADTSDRALVRPGMSADVIISVTEKRGALLVPVEAVNMEKSRRTVEVWSAARQFEARAVEVGEHDGDRIEILSGITERDRVRVAGLRVAASKP